jgi:antitoxin component of MazEF toxin-antitoxin module
MRITSIQKVIKVGDSLALTIPAKDARFNNVQVGELLEMDLKRPKKKVNHTTEIVDITQQLIARHKTALKNLNQR